MTVRKNRALPSARCRRLLRPLTCALGAALLLASSAGASVTIGYDSLVRGNAGQDFSILSSALYVPFAFDFDGPYALDSVRLLLFNANPSQLSLLVTSTLGTDLTVPTALTTFSAEGPIGGEAVYTFHADAPAVLTSGSTYYLRMASPGQNLQWVSLLSLSGEPPAGSDVPNTHDGPGNTGPPGHDTGIITLTSLTTLNPNVFTFRQVSTDFTYTDISDGPYGISITASAVPEPSAVALLIGGGALAFALLRRQFRKR
jgi:hypothetical protein